MFVIATNDRGAVFHIPPMLSIGGEFLNNFQRVLERTDFFRALLNSLFVSSMVTVSVVFFCTLAGYAFAKYDFPLKNALFYFVIATLFVPTQLSVLPTYIIMAKLHWIDTYKALIVPAMVNAFGIFWMRQYISTAVHSELMLFSNRDGLDYGMIMSATFTATLPLLIVFLLFSRWVIAGLTSGAIKS
nr:hypothetical protein [Paenibacillus sp. AR247]